MSGKIVQIKKRNYTWGDRGNREFSNPFQLNIADFQIGKREKILLQGPSGSGKSTLAGLLCGTIRPSAGEISVVGRSLNGLSAIQLDRHRADNIGIIFQLLNLVPYLSALENVLLPLEFSKLRKLNVGMDRVSFRKEAMRLMKELGLDSFHDYNAKPVNLSVGQQQRVAAARALIGSPGLVIADEPTSALDEENRTKFLELLFTQAEKSGSSLLMISHDFSLAHHFDRTVSLENGSIGKAA